MAVKIRLDRTGTKNRPYYRVIIVDRRNSGGSRCIEIVGQYDPLAKEDRLNVDRDKILAWIKKGAEPTLTVRKLLGKAGILEKLDLSSLPKKPPKSKAKEEGKEGEKKEEKKPGSPAEAPKKEAVKEKAAEEQPKQA